MQRYLARLGLVALSLTALHCVSSDVSDCSFSCFPSSTAAVQFSSPLTAPGSYELAIKDDSGTVDVTCSFSLPCSPSPLNLCLNTSKNSSSVQMICSAQTGVSAGQVSGLSAISAKSGANIDSSNTSSLSFSLTRSGSVVASRRLEIQPEFSVRRDACSCDDGRSSWVVDVQ